jgi:hypothetical protein
MIDLNPSRNLAAHPRAGCFHALTEPLSGRKPVLFLLSVSAWLVLFISVNPATGQTWALTDAPILDYVSSVASSADGTKLVEVTVADSHFGVICTSTNSGFTWTVSSAPYYNWESVASSSDGTFLVAVGQVYSGYDFPAMYTSTNSGVSWMRVANAPGGDWSWSCVASSADGSKLVAASVGIYTSTNSASTWTLSSAPYEAWSSAASSANGRKLVAVADGGGIYTSTNSGFTWTQTTAPSTNWTSVASSADGTKLVAAAGTSHYGSSSNYSGAIYTSADSGFTWILSSAPNYDWQSVASSADGSKLTAAAGGPLGSVYTSTNSGFTWTQTSVPNGSWGPIASSADGTKLVAAGPGGVYVATSSPSAPLILSQPPNLMTGLAGSSVWLNVAVFAAVPITYQWQKNGLNLMDAANLQGSATDTLTLDNITAADAGVYVVFVTNAFGWAESAEVVLQVVVSPPVITMQPTNQTIAPGLTATFSVSAVGDFPLFYQWRRNGISLSDGGKFSGCLTPTLNVENVSAANTGTYSVIVSNSAGSDISAGAVLALIPGLTLTSAPSTNWTSVASSADGTKLVAVGSDPAYSYLTGPIYTSANSGLSWNLTSAPDEFWSSVASSADGTKLVAAASGGGIYTSTNSGFTWTLTSAPSTNYWNCVASSTDGTKLVAAAGYGGIYTSTNSGFTWTSNNAPIVDVHWTSVVVSADGTKLVSSYDSGDSGIYTSTNSGLTWTLRSPPGYGWQSVASSADGSKLIAAGEDGLIYSSTNSGFTWSWNIAPGLYSQLVAISADGSKLVAAGYGVYISVDGGATWAWGGVSATSVACSADGAKLVIVENAANGGGIYTWQTTPAPSLSIAPASTNAVLSWIIPSQSFALQENSDLTANNWTDLTNTPMVLNLTNLQNQVIVPMPHAGNVYYRLKH